MIDDGALLRQYLEERSEEAFTELVRRHLSVVYFAALRRVGGDRHLADDVAQSVFADLAKKAATLKDRPVLVGWLYTSTRFAAAQAVRAEQRRRTHEQEAQAMQELHSTPEANWEQLRPVIDGAMDDLNEQEREIVLLRFFERLPLAEVGARFSISTDAARMRVDRALDKLRGLLARRGIASTSTALGAVVATQSGVAAPAEMLAKIIRSVLHRSGAATATLAAGKILGGVAAAGLALGLMVYAVEHRPPAVPVVAATGPDLASVEGAPSVVEGPAGATPAGAIPRPTGPTLSGGPFGRLSAPARDVLKALWSHEEETPVGHPAINLGKNSANSAIFQAGSQDLLAQNLAAVGPRGGLRLTDGGAAFCRSCQQEIEGYPPFFHPAQATAFSQLTPAELGILKALWSAQDWNQGIRGRRISLRVTPGAVNYGTFAAGRELLLGKKLVALSPNGQSVHLTEKGLVLCRNQQRAIDAYPPFYHPSPGPGSLGAEPE